MQKKIKKARSFFIYQKLIVCIDFIALKWYNIKEVSVNERRNLMNIYDKKEVKLFVSALMSLENENECIKFLNDIMTTKEVLDMSQRIMVAKMLAEGNIYSKIEAETGASSATISRVNRCFQYGDGGYKDILEKLK